MSNPSGGKLSTKINQLTNPDLGDILQLVDSEAIPDGDSYTDWHPKYSLVPVVRAFILKEVRDLDNETGLARYLREDLGVDIGLESTPNQSTLWRAWNERLTEEQRQFVEETAEAIEENSRRQGIHIPLTEFQPDDKDPESSERTKRRYVSEKTKEVTKKAKEVIYPCLELSRAQNSAVHENTFWDLQTYIGMRDSMAVNEGARSFLVDSSRDRTPLGHVHRHHLKKHSVGDFREMYQEGVENVIERARQNSELDRGVTVAIDITEGDFYGDRTGHEDEILGSKNKKNEWGHQWATIQIVGEDIPLVLDVMPVKKGDKRHKIVAELLDNASEHVRIYRVLMDREFDSAKALKEIDDRGHLYLVPKSKRNSQRETIRWMNKKDVESTVLNRKLLLESGKDGRHETNMLYVPKEDWDGELENGHENKVVFLTNMDIEEEAAIPHVRRYRDRWGIENGYKKIKEFMALTTSKDFSLRYFYFAFACLLYNIWRLVDVLVKQTFDKEGAREPLVTANDFLTIAKKFIDPGG